MHTTSIDGRKDKTLESETDLIELKKQKCSAPSEGTRASSLIHFWREMFNILSLL
jgi:hypothetical protein